MRILFYFIYFTTHLTFNLECSHETDNEKLIFSDELILQNYLCTSVGNKKNKLNYEVSHYKKSP